MTSILFDISILSEPKGNRCIYQLTHLATICKHLGLEVYLLVDDDAISKCQHLSTLKEHFVRKRVKTDIYFAKCDAYFKNENWDIVKNIDGYKICACNSDRTFRENTCTVGRRIGGAAQDRCDLYMPVNYTKHLIGKYSHKVIPASHPIDPRIFNYFKSIGVEKDYLLDNIGNIRSKFNVQECAIARFIGNIKPNRGIVQEICGWAEYTWARFKPPNEYVEYLLGARGCLDIRGFGDKNIRFIEGVLLGRTIITIKTESDYDPPLIDGYNCIIKKSWEDLRSLQFNSDEWSMISDNATMCYKAGWSLLAQMKKAIGAYNAVHSA